MIYHLQSIGWFLSGFACGTRTASSMAWYNRFHIDISNCQFRFSIVWTPRLGCSYIQSIYIIIYIWNIMNSYKIDASNIFQSTPTSLLQVGRFTFFFISRPVASIRCSNLDAKTTSGTYRNTKNTKQFKWSWKSIIKLRICFFHGTINNANDKSNKLKKINASLTTFQQFHQKITNFIHPDLFNLLVNSSLNLSNSWKKPPLNRQKCIVF